MPGFLSVMQILCFADVGITVKALITIPFGYQDYFALLMPGFLFLSYFTTQSALSEGPK